MGFSFWHLIILLVVILLFFGPQRLPSLGRSVGEAIRGFKKGLEDSEIDVTDNQSNRQERLHESEDRQEPSQAQHQDEKDKHRS